MPLLVKMGAGQNVIDVFHGAAGNLAVAYLMYKLATPARYTVTVGGTYLTVKYLRKWGYMAPIPEGDKLRDLAKDSRKQVKERYGEMKEDMKERIADQKEKITRKKKS